MDVVNVKLNVKSFFDNENNCWVVKSDKYNISGCDKTIDKARHKLAKSIDEILELDELQRALRINQLETNFREIRGQLLSFGLKEDGVLINSIDLILKNK